jgi:hypothetical protein
VFTKIGGVRGEGDGVRAGCANPWRSVLVFVCVGNGVPGLYQVREYEQVQVQVQTGLELIAGR